jgi:tRNA(Ile2) C34 agmatinyltransferase TiaS
MELIKWSIVKGSVDMVSSILNWVCPECGGRMGGRGKEFKCQGVCLTDWRQIWEQSLSVEPRRLPTALNSPRLAMNR